MAEEPTTELRATAATAAPSPEELAAARASPRRHLVIARRCAAVAGVVCFGTIAATLGSDELAGPIVAVHIVLLLLSLATLHQFRRVARSKRRYSWVKVGRALLCVSFFAAAYLIIDSAQNLRRCVTDLCESPTLFGTRAQCLAPCTDPVSAAAQIPALILTTLSAIAPLRWPTAAGPSWRYAMSFVSTA